jgi:hypothetical protein
MHVDDDEDQSSRVLRDSREISLFVAWKRSVGEGDGLEEERKKFWRGKEGFLLCGYF